MSEVMPRIRFRHRYLEIPPVDSAETAFKVAIAAKAKQT